jgi:hypothetical protein
VIKACSWKDSVMLRRHLTKESARNGKVMTDPTFAFQLQAYPNGHPPPTLLQKEVEMSSAAPFLLVNPGFSKMEVVKAYCHTSEGSCYTLLEANNRNQEKRSGGTNESGAHIQSPACDGQQDCSG